MFGSVFSIPLALIFLSVLIFVHELSHFLAGKLVGIHADVFSIGFGPALLRVQRGRTEYRISAIPAGGYVKFPGEYAHEGADRLQGDFHEAPVWKRMFVVVAGPTSNLVLGVVLLAALAGIGLPQRTAPVIGEVVQSAGLGGTYWDDPNELSPAAKAGLQPGDEIVAVGGRNVESWEQFTQEVVIRPDRPTSLSIIRNGSLVELMVTPRPVLRGKMTIGHVGVAARQPVAIMAARSGSNGPAEQVVVESINGTAVGSMNAFREVARSHPSEAVALRLEDGTEQLVQVLSLVHAAWQSESALAAQLPDLSGDAHVVTADGEPVADIVGLRNRLIADIGGETTLELTSSEGARGTATLHPELAVTVTGVDAEKFSAVRPLRMGDRLLAVESRPVAAYEEMHSLLVSAAEAGRSVRLTFERKSSVLFVHRDSVIDVQTHVFAQDGNIRIPGLRLESNYAGAQPYLAVGDMAFAEGMELVRADSGQPMDVAFADPPMERYGPIGAVAKGTEMTATMVVQTLSFLKRLVTAEVSVVHVSGPVGIVKYTQSTISRGGLSMETVLRVLMLMALISVNLAVVNLLPIPIADGGQMLFFAVEGIRGRPMALKWQIAIQQVSVLVLIGIFALVTLKDLVYW